MPPLNYGVRFCICHILLCVLLPLAQHKQYVARLKSASQFLLRVRIPKKIELVAVIQSIATSQPFRSQWRAAARGNFCCKLISRIFEMGGIKRELSEGVRQRPNYFAYGNSPCLEAQRGRQNVVSPKEKW
jgi:hypothetical protein